MDPLTVSLIMGGGSMLAKFFGDRSAKKEADKDRKREDARRADAMRFTQANHAARKALQQKLLAHGGDLTPTDYDASEMFADEGNPFARPSGIKPVGPRAEDQAFGDEFLTEEERRRAKLRGY